MLMYDYEIDDDAKVIFQSMKDKIENLIFQKHIKKYKSKYRYWLNWVLGIKYPFNDTNIDWR